MVTYFISDLHLQESDPDSAKLFFHFLATKAIDADALYILGDFFELWVGDDTDSLFQRKVKAALIKLAQAQVSVYFMPGNRDFLLNKDFAKQSQFQLLTDPTVIKLYDHEYLLSHGDCFVKHFAYRCFRYLCRNKLIQSIFLRLPLKFRLWLAKKLRNKSKANYYKLTKTNPAALDVNQQLVNYALLHYNVSALIHGHTHQPGIHAITLPNGGSAQRIVLGCWGKQAQIFACRPSGGHLETIAVTT